MQERRRLPDNFLFFIFEVKKASSCAACLVQWAKEMSGVTLRPKIPFYYGFTRIII
jgi:hypothetical protein